MRPASLRKSGLRAPSPANRKPEVSVALRHTQAESSHKPVFNYILKTLLKRFEIKSSLTFRHVVSLCLVVVDISASIHDSSWTSQLMTTPIGYPRGKLIPEARLNTDGLCQLSSSKRNDRGTGKHLLYVPGITEGKRYAQRVAERRQKSEGGVFE